MHGRLRGDDDSKHGSDDNVGPFKNPHNCQELCSSSSAINVSSPLPMSTPQDDRHQMTVPPPAPGGNGHHTTVT